jgi:hypothetical protein
LPVPTIRRRPSLVGASARGFHAKGATVNVVEYPGAYHLFDGTEPLHFIAEAGTAASCDAEFDTDAREIDKTFPPPLCRPT